MASQVIRSKRIDHKQLQIRAGVFIKNKMKNPEFLLRWNDLLPFHITDPGWSGFYQQ